MKKSILYRIVVGIGKVSKYLLVIVYVWIVGVFFTGMILGGDRQDVLRTMPIVLKTFFKDTLPVCMIIAFLAVLGNFVGQWGLRQKTDK